MRTPNDFGRPPYPKDHTIRWIIAAVIVGLLVLALFYGLIAFVVIHFIQKWW